MSKLDILPHRMRPAAGRLLSRGIELFHALDWMISPPTTAKNIVASMLVPVEYDLGYLDETLFDLSLHIIGQARANGLDHLASRVKQFQFEQITRFPGEHYRLLQAVMRIVKPQLVVEIGTFTGLSALVISQALGAGSRLVTYDVVPWDQFPDTVLRLPDFSPSFQQRLGDLANKHLPILCEGNHRRGGSSTLAVRNHHWFATLKGADNRVGRSEVNSDCFGHSYS